MSHIILKVPRKRVYYAAVVGQSLKGQWCDKLRCVFRHDDMYIGPCLAQRTGYIRHLIGGNPARHAQYHTFSL